MSQLLQVSGTNCLVRCCYCGAQVPRVFIGEACIGGGSDVEGLARSGKLEGMLQKIGALQ